MSNTNQEIISQETTTDKDGNVVAVNTVYKENGIVHYDSVSESTLASLSKEMSGKRERHKRTPEEYDQMQFDRMLDNNWLSGSNPDPDTQPSKVLQVVEVDGEKKLVGKVMVDNLKDQLSTPEQKQSLRDLTEETREKIKDTLKQTFKPKKPGNAEAHWDARMKAQAMKTVKRRKANKAARRARKNS